MSEIPAEIVPDEPAIAGLSDEEYADLLTEIEQAPITEDTGH